jgi:hypothetical protein
MIRARSTSITRPWPLLGRRRPAAPRPNEHDEAERALIGRQNEAMIARAYREAQLVALLLGGGRYF